MASKDNRPQALMNVTSELKGAYNCLLSTYEVSKKAAPKPDVLLREIDKTMMLLEHAKEAIRHGQATNAFAKSDTPV